MSAFGKKGNAGGMKPGGRPAFGVARPMKGGAQAAQEANGGEQFPPLPEEGAAPKASPAASAAPAAPAKGSTAEAMDRLAERAAAVQNAEKGP